MSVSKVYVASIGMLTPIGVDAVSTAAAIRAGISAYSDSNHQNRHLNPMRMALIPDNALPPLHKELEPIAGLTSRNRRMLRIASPALQSVLNALPLTEPPPLFLATSEIIPDCPSTTNKNFLDYLITQSGMKINRLASKLLPVGRAGGIQAIDLAFSYLESSGKDVALVGGVDTYLDNFVLAALDRENRILAENIQNGFAPGEGAGFLLLISERVLSKLPGKPHALLYRPGLAKEAGHRYSQEPYKGDGLSSAFKAALQNSVGSPVEAIYASLNGESFGTKELGVACLRNKNAFTENVKTEHPADCFGDIGAAFGPVLIGIISTLKPGNSLCYCSSENDHRAAIYVSK